MDEQSRVETIDASARANRVSWGSRLVAGIADGILSAILMMGFMMAYSNAIGEGVTMPLKALGGLVYGVEALVAGSIAMLAGAGIQIGFSIVLGILFALCMCVICRARDRNRHLGCDGPGRIAVHEPDDGGADCSDADGVLRRASAFRHRSRIDATFHPRVQRQG
jgi:hypothetical protein